MGKETISLSKDEVRIIKEWFQTMFRISGELEERDKPLIKKLASFLGEE